MLETPKYNNFTTVGWLWVACTIAGLFATFSSSDSVGIQYLGIMLSIYGVLVFARPTALYRRPQDQLGTIGCMTLGTGIALALFPQLVTALGRHG